MLLATLYASLTTVRSACMLNLDCKLFCLICRNLGDDPMANQPEDISNLTCSDYDHILTPAQMDLCERNDKDYLPCMALGIKRAIQWCRKVFKDELWNCTRVMGDYVLGKIVHLYCESQRTRYGVTILLQWSGLLYVIGTSPTGCEESSTLLFATSGFPSQRVHCMWPVLDARALRGWHVHPYFTSHATPRPRKSSNPVIATEDANCDACWLRHATLKAEQLMNGIYNF